MASDKVGLKNSYRILFEPEMEEALLNQKKLTHVTVAEHVRRAIRFYLMFVDEKTGRVPDLAINKFWAEWQARESMLKQNKP